MKNWFQWGSLMVVLIGWIALTCLWAGGISTKVDGLDASDAMLKSQNTSLTASIESLNKRLTETNIIMWMHLPPEAKLKITIK